MAGDEKLITCYNRGCGNKFNPNCNPNDACRFHSGAPFFHDAYKGWSCCNKKCTDFTDFLNIPGCTVAKHSNQKPPELPKPEKEPNPEEVIEVKPAAVSTIKRPPLNSEMITMVPEISTSLQQQREIVLTQSVNDSLKLDENNLVVGTSCKNGGCNKFYQGPDSNVEICVYHPGCPIFHEGLKFWSCCQKRTSDFNAFLNQEGCEQGNHRWYRKEDETRTVECRWDWHQTGNFVVLTVYAKQYCPKKSIVQLNPVRAVVNLIFPLEKNSFNLDVELFGVIDVAQSHVSMFGTKVEIKLKKAELKNWSKLNISMSTTTSTSKQEDDEKHKVDLLAPEIDAVDLSDL